MPIHLIYGNQNQDQCIEEGLEIQSMIGKNCSVSSFANSNKFL